MKTGFAQILRNKCFKAEPHYYNYTYDNMFKIIIITIQIYLIYFNRLIFKIISLSKYINNLLLMGFFSLYKYFLFMT